MADAVHDAPTSALRLIADCLFGSLCIYPKRLLCSCQAYGHEQNSVHVEHFEPVPSLSQSLSSIIFLKFCT